VLVSGLAVASGIPWIFVALPAGALTDRLDKRRVVFGVEMARALLLGLVAAGVATGRIGLVGIYIAAFLIGVGETFVAAITRSVVPLIVDDEGLLAANGHVFAAETTGEKFAGPAIGGVLFGYIAALPFVSDAVSFVASAVLLRSAVPIPAPRSTDTTTTARGVWQEVRTGLRWLFGHAQLRLLAMVVTTFAFCQAMVFGVLVLFATRTLHLHPSEYGLLLAFAAIGDVLASLVAGRIHRWLGAFKTIMVSGLVAGIAYVALGLTSYVALAAVALLIEAAAVTLGNVATLSARHRIIPTKRFGLINNGFRMCVMGVVPAGALIGGALGDIFGLTTTFIAAGAVQLVVLIALAAPLRSTALDDNPGRQPTN
jgi:Na+/melibiose symporter-like transporter